MTNLSKLFNILMHKMYTYIYIYIYIYIYTHKFIYYILNI